MDALAEGAETGDLGLFVRSEGFRLRDFVGLEGEWRQQCTTSVFLFL